MAETPQSDPKETQNFSAPISPDDNIKDLIDETLMGAQYGVGRVPYHTHNGVDSPLVSQAPNTTVVLSLNTGSGVDGVGHFTSSGTLASAKFYTDLTIDAGVVLDTFGYPIYYSGTCTNNGTIRNNGQNGTTATTYQGGAGGAGGLGGSFTAGTSGGAGADSDGNSVAGTNANPALGVNGTIGGAGGQGSSGTAGGVANGGGTAVMESLSSTVGYFPLTFISGLESSTSLSGFTFTGTKSSLFLSSSAGSSGGGGGKSEPGIQQGGGGGGAGGSGGIVVLIGNILINNGSIQSRGGDGGAGAPAQNASSGGGGGGAGGSGGVVCLAYKSFSGSGTVDCNAGSGGSGGAKGGGGSSTDGSAGAAGNVGNIYKAKLV